jgi:hypothetical protein
MTACAIAGMLYYVWNSLSISLLSGQYIAAALILIPHQVHAIGSFEEEEEFSVQRP